MLDIMASCLNPLIRVLAAFIPVKTWRKNFKRNLTVLAQDYLYVHKKPQCAVLHTGPGDVLIATIAFNNPFVIELQAYLLKQFLRDAYRQMIFDNSTSPVAREQIQRICQHQNLSYIGLPHNHYSGKSHSYSHGIALNWAVHFLRRYKTPFLAIFDHDIFPWREHSLVELVSRSGVYGVVHRHTESPYFWPGFLVFERSRIRSRLDFRPFPGHDTGARLCGSLYDATMLDGDHSPPWKWVNLLGEEKGDCEGSARQDATFEILGDYIHTNNASYWSPGTPKEPYIVSFLEKKTGINLASFASRAPSSFRNK